jgi:hypothetical protein
MNAITQHGFPRPSASIIGSSHCHNLISKVTPIQAIIYWP